jgi:hypothetical protein
MRRQKVHRSDIPDGIIVASRKQGTKQESKERKHENRKHAFGCALSGAFGRYVDITSLGATRRVGGGRRKV